MTIVRGLPAPCSVAGVSDPKILLLCMSLSVACLSCARAHAEGPDTLFTGDVQFMSNYVGRGISNSVGQPSVSAELDYNPGDGVYAGIDGNSINILDELYPGDSASLLLEGLIGYRQAFARDWLWKAGVQRVQFPGRYVPQPSPMEEPNTTEAFGYIRWKWLSAKLNYAVTDYYGTAGSRGSSYADLGAAYPVGEAWTFGAHLGRKTLTGNDPVSDLKNSRKDYTDYKLSVTYAFGSGISLTLAHTWSNANPALYTVDGYNVAGHQTWLLLERDM